MERFDDKIEKWYESKIAFLITVLTPVVISLAFLLGMKTDIALIQQNIANINTNHEAHIQDILAAMKDMKADQAKQQDQIIELQKEILLIIQK